MSVSTSTRYASIPRTAAERTRASIGTRYRRRLLPDNRRSAGWCGITRGGLELQTERDRHEPLRRLTAPEHPEVVRRQHQGRPTPLHEKTDPRARTKRRGTRACLPCRQPAHGGPDPPHHRRPGVAFDHLRRWGERERADWADELIAAARGRKRWTRVGDDRTPLRNMDV